MTLVNRKNTLRDYQQEVVTRIHEAWEKHRSVMVQMPTGTGKTHVLTQIVNELLGTDYTDKSEAKRILIVAHRIELITQIKETLGKLKIINEKLEVKSGELEVNSEELKVKRERIKVESIQTISRRIDSLDFTPDLIIIDEAHHALAMTYRILWEKWQNAKFLGLTATPCRMNRKGFTDLFDVLVSSWSIAEFVDRGVLSPFDYVSIRPNSADQQLIDSLEKRGADGDYQVKEMDAVLNKRPSIERLYQSMMEFAKGKKGIVYAISIDHARSIAEYYNQNGICSVAIDSKTPMAERKQLVEEFKDGKIQVLVNVDVFSEGFDCPDVEFVQMARPTLSLSKYLQQVGRGLRKSEGKECCMLIDNVGLYKVFGLPVVRWNWDAMFRGAETGKGIRTTQSGNNGVACAYSSMKSSVAESDLELVISHDALLTKLNELDKCPTATDKKVTLKVWQDDVTCLWGLRCGKDKVTKAEYLSVFDIKDDLAAVRFGNYECGLVDARGDVVWKWKQRDCLSLRFIANRFLVVHAPNSKEYYVDLCNFATYDSKPEVKRFGKFELLKVDNACHSRTKTRYSSKADFGSLVISDMGHLLTIFDFDGNGINHSGGQVCLLEGDAAECYKVFKWLSDGSVVISSADGIYYHVECDGKKVALNKCSDSQVRCYEEIERLDLMARKECEMREEEKKRKLHEECRSAIPYQAGMKWGLKIGDRVTVPPIYRNIKNPVGKFCIVEKNYRQWGVISIDGSILIEPKYPDVSIEENGVAWLTQVTGKKIKVRLK